MGASGNPWVSMGTPGFQWVPMGPHGPHKYPWVSKTCAEHAMDIWKTFAEHSVAIMLAPNELTGGSRPPELTAPPTPHTAHPCPPLPAPPPSTPHPPPSTTMSITPSYATMGMNTSSAAVGINSCSAGMVVLGIPIGVGWAGLGRDGLAWGGVEGVRGWRGPPPT
jgi:hypothetical protein